MKVANAVMGIAEQALAQLAQLLKMPTVGVVGVHREEAGWLVTAEMLEKRSIPDAMDVLGGYEVHVDGEGNVLEFARTYLRKRTEDVS